MLEGDTGVIEHGLVERQSHAIETCRAVSSVCWIVRSPRRVSICWEPRGVLLSDHGEVIGRRGRTRRVGIGGGCKAPAPPAWVSPGLDAAKVKMARTQER